MTLSSFISTLALRRNFKYLEFEQNSLRLSTREPVSEVWRFNVEEPHERWPRGECTRFFRGWKEVGFMRYSWEVRNVPSKWNLHWRYLLASLDGSIKIGVHVEFSSFKGLFSNWTIHHFGKNTLTSGNFMWIYHNSGTFLLLLFFFSLFQHSSGSTRCAFLERFARAQWLVFLLGLKDPLLCIF